MHFLAPVSSGVFGMFGMFGMFPRVCVCVCVCALACLASSACFGMFSMRGLLYVGWRWGKAL